MKILLLSDLHIGYRQYNKIEREKDILNAFKTVIMEEKDNTDIMIIAGDLIHHKDLTAAQWIELREVLSLYGKPIYAIEGNHDIAKFHDVGWLKVLNDDGLITLMNDSDTYFEGDIAIHALNWAGKIIPQMIPEPTPLKFNIFVCHGGIVGKINKDIGEIDKDVLDAMMPKYDLIVTGHYHFAYNIDKLYNPGGLEITSFAEVDKDKGYYVYDTKTRKATFKPYKGKRNFVVIETDIDGIDDLKKYDGDVLRVIVTDTAERFIDVNKSLLMKKIAEKSGALYVKVDMINKGINIKNIVGEVKDIYEDVLVEILSKDEVNYFNMLIDEFESGNDIDNVMREWYDKRNRD